MKKRERSRRDPILRLEQQRADADCTIACIASITGRSYEDVLIAAANEDTRPHENGLYLTAIVRISRSLGYPMRVKRRCDFRSDKGILHVILRSPKDHVVILMGGLIFDQADVTVWLPNVFAARYKARFGTILVPDV